MNKKEFKKYYIAHCENTAPDMEKLWEKIESGLEEKPESRVTSKPAKAFSFRKAAVWCTACAAVLIAVPAILVGTGVTKTADSMTAEMQNEAVAGDMETNAASAEEDGFVEEPADEDIGTAAADTATTSSLPEMVYYEELSLSSPVPTEAPLPTPTAEPFGDDFFVEENVLAETDIIVDAVVNQVYSSGGDTVFYVLNAEDSDKNNMGSITVESATPYAMKIGREYILPLKETGDGYRLVFENAPQIECTLDGGVVFHNGWKSLDENSCYVSYPKGGVDDFFYDRMRFSYKDGIGVLDEKWKALQNDRKED